MIKKDKIRIPSVPDRKHLTNVVRKLSYLPVNQRPVRVKPQRLSLPEKTGLTICVQRKLGGIGDVLMTTPMVATLRYMYPDATITYATDPPLFKVLENNPTIDLIVDFRTINPVAYDFFVDVSAVCPPFEHKTKPPINRIDIFGLKTGVSIKDRKPIYVVKDEERTWANTWLERTWGKRSEYKFVIISVASVDHKRTWPVKYSHELVNLLNASRPDLKFFIDDFNGIGGEWNHPNTVTKRFGFREFGALMEQADLFIGPDSGPLHLAGALEKPIVAIFGSTDPNARINHYVNAVAATNPVPCQSCIHPDETIMLANSVLPIKDVQVTDRIYDKRGIVQDVVERHHHIPDHDMLEIEVMGTNIPLRLTTNHRLESVPRGHTRKVHRRELVKLDNKKIIFANDLQKDDYLLYPINELFGTGVFRTDYKGHPSAKPIPTEIVMDYDMGWLMGYYIAEGFSSKVGRSYSLNFVSGPTEQDLRANLERILKEKFNIGCTHTKQPNNLAVTTTVCCASLARSLSGYCGSKSLYKHIPFDIIPNDLNIVKGVLDGLLAGDGYSDDRSVVLGTASKTLAYQVRSLGMHLGQLPKLYYRLKNTNYKSNAQYWRVEFVGTNKSPSRLNMTDVISEYTGLGFKSPDGYWAPIRSIKTIPRPEYVCDLSVANSKSYTVNGIAVENCWYQKCEFNKVCLTGLSPVKVRDLALGKLNNKSLSTLLESEFIINVLSPELEPVGNEFRALLPQHQRLNKVSISLLDTDYVPASLARSNDIISVAYVWQTGIVLNHTLNLLLNKNFDLVLTNTQECLDFLWSKGVRKPMYCVLPPIQKGIEPEIKSDLNPNSVSLMTYQNLHHGNMVALNEHNRLPIPDEFVLYLNDTDVLNPNELIQDSFIEEWASNNLGQTALNKILTLINHKL